MPDLKYGRLFTEDDVVAIVREVLVVHGLNPMGARHYAAEGLRKIEQATRFPADEPLFLLRGQDIAAPRAIADGCDGEADYLACARSADAGHEHLTAIEHAADEMRAWQRANPDRVKVPG